MNPVSRRASASLVLAVALALSVSVGATADPVEPCDALTLEEVNSLSGLEFELMFGHEQGCQYGGPVGSELAYLVSLWLDDSYTYDELASDETAELLTVGDYRAVYSYGNLEIDAGDFIVTITAIPDLEMTETTAESLQMSIHAAELVLDDLPNFHLHAPPDPAELAKAAGLPEISSVDWRLETHLTGEEVLDEAHESDIAFVTPLMDAASADWDQVSLVDARILSALSGDELGSYRGIGISGSDSQVVLAAAIDLLRVSAGGEELGIEVVTMAGKDVRKLTGPDGSHAWVYVADGTAHFILAPEDVAASIIESLEP